MPALTADRTPDQLAGEMQRFFGVDWPTVWAGVPEDEAKRTHWCAGFGWRPLWFEGGLRVHTTLGSRLHLASAAPGRPVTRVEHTVWAARARGTDENEHVTDLTELRWTAHLDALRRIMGQPSWNGAWDAPDFPELPGRGPWYSPQWRLVHQDPRRVAAWWFSSAEAPVIELRMALGTESESGTTPGDARIDLVCHGPADPEDREPIWLG
ncbi:hypothetical protein PV733_08275 [Streptomyces europaeiscabiei]|uniref:hypothetical protein n=1 Tax=Streptomyces europaeiscabiei TaxID=146819 RepID=UPI0029BB0C36|nr:hypothetical protein [Streptomyces europaeiscabiei]MDX2774681.1 hypothetical protein [Streptomyces europaeiscabiei]MDX3668177.1 hypothetical protein [Streptomyces europaeiscabiei]MDX3708968.1 hypothetical protein [Streptomyces europaeiscabiei]